MADHDRALARGRSTRAWLQVLLRDNKPHHDLVGLLISFRANGNILSELPCNTFVVE